MKTKSVELSGFVSSVNDDLIDADEFLDKFIEFVEYNNWKFFGMTGPETDENDE